MIRRDVVASRWALVFFAVLTVALGGCQSCGRAKGASELVYESAPTVDPDEPSPERIPELWARIERAVRAISPENASHLRPPATEAQIAELERKLGRTLPETYKAGLRLHDGESLDTDAGIWWGSALLPVERVVETYEMHRRVARSGPWAGEKEDPRGWRRSIRHGVMTVVGNVKPMFFSPDWIQISDSNGDLGLYLDFDPAPGGHLGQVILIDHESVWWEVVADSYGAWLERYADDLEAGRYHVEPDLGLWPVDDRDPPPGQLPPYLR